MIEPTNAGEWKVRIERSIYNEGLKFYVLRYVPHLELLQPDGSLLRISEGVTTDSIKPTFILSGVDGKAMMFALAEALEDEGIKTSNDFKAQGLLEATKYHLEDMRTLLKLKKESNDR